MRFHLAGSYTTPEDRAQFERGRRVGRKIVNFFRTAGQVIADTARGFYYVTIVVLSIALAAIVASFVISLCMLIIGGSPFVRTTVLVALFVFYFIGMSLREIKS